MKHLRQAVLDSMDLAALQNRVGRRAHYLAEASCAAAVAHAEATVRIRPAAAVGQKNANELRRIRED